MAKMNYIMICWTFLVFNTMLRSWELFGVSSSSGHRVPAWRRVPQSAAARSARPINLLTNSKEGERNAKPEAGSCWQRPAATADEPSSPTSQPTADTGYPSSGLKERHTMGTQRSWSAYPSIRTQFLLLTSFFCILVHLWALSGQMGLLSSSLRGGYGNLHWFSLLLEMEQIEDTYSDLFLCRRTEDPRNPGAGDLFISP